MKAERKENRRLGDVSLRGTTDPPGGRGKLTSEMRRKEIKRRVADPESGTRRVKELADDVFDCSESLLYKDRDYFRRHQIAIGIRRGEFVSDQESLRLVSRRSSEQSPAKGLIGRLGAILISSLGPSTPNEATPARQRTHRRSEAEQEPPDREGLASFISRCMPEGLKMRSDLYMKLGALDRRAHRLAILDAGSTTLKVAQALVQVATPDPRRHLSALRVLTNGKMIANELDQPKCHHEIILLGGALRSETQAVAGALAERCLDAWGISDSGAGFADIAIIGTTGVQRNSDGFFECYCDHESEQQIKSRLLSAARIRCIAADSRKLIQKEGGKHGFAVLDPAFVDIVLTDQGILPAAEREDQMSDNREQQKQEFLDYAEKKELCVAAAREVL